MAGVAITAPGHVEKAVVQLKSIARILAFAKDSHGNPLTLQDLATKYSFEPDGTNFYYGLNDQNLDTFTKTKNPFSQQHQDYFKLLIDSVTASHAEEKTLVLGVEPPQIDDPYTFVDANKDLVRALATGLTTLRQQALSAGKRLNIAIRYASEMNDKPQANKYAGSPDRFRASFVNVRSIFREVAPAVLFSFSPAIRVDLPESAITQYWPGDDYVDVIGGTWYVGDAADWDVSYGNMQAYFRHRAGLGKAFALSEVGGCEVRDPAPSGNDTMLNRMLHELEALDLYNISFKYVTLFLEGKWGVDARLAFLSSSTQSA